jgi:hypothetical protein
MSSIETFVYTYVGFIGCLVLCQFISLIYYCCKYDCCYIYTLFGRYCIKLCGKSKEPEIDILDFDTKKMPLIQTQLYDEL